MLTTALSLSVMVIHEGVIHGFGAHEIPTLGMMRRVMKLLGSRMVLHQLARMHGRAPPHDLVRHDDIPLDRVGSLVIGMGCVMLGRLLRMMRMEIARIRPAVVHLLGRKSSVAAAEVILGLLLAHPAIVRGAIQGLRPLRMHPSVEHSGDLLRRRLPGIGPRDGPAGLERIVVGRLLLSAVDLSLLGLESRRVLLGRRRLLSPVSDGLEEGRIRLLGCRLLLLLDHGKGLSRLGRDRLRLGGLGFRELDHFGELHGGGLDGSIRRFRLGGVSIGSDGLPERGIGLDALLGGCGGRVGRIHIVVDGRAGIGARLLEAGRGLPVPLLLLFLRGGSGG